MSDRKPINPFKRNRTRRAFLVQARPARRTAAHMIACGHNPYAAVMQEKDLSAAHVIKQMDLDAYAARMDWPQTVPRPTPAQILDMVCNRDDDVAPWEPDGEFVYRFCRMAGITPDALVPYDSKKPAQAEIVEAAMWTLERAHFEKTHPGQALLDFVRDEINKADHAKQLHWQMHYPDNGTMLGVVEGIYSEYVQSQPGVTRESELYCSGKVPTLRVPLRVIREQQQMMLGYYANFILDGIEKGHEPKKALQEYYAWRRDEDTLRFLDAAANAQYLRAHISDLARDRHTVPTVYVSRP